MALFDTKLNDKSTDKLILQSSFPSLILLIGCLIFYSQVTLSWWKPNSPSSLLLTGFSTLVVLAGIGIAALLLIKLIREALEELRGLGVNLYLVNAIAIVLLIFFAISFFSALKPAHRFPEGDFLEYHLYIPKQGWLLGNWSPIDWNTSEFFTLPIDYGLSFLWVGLPLLNRLPQFIIFCFLAIKTILFFKYLDIKTPLARGLVALLCLLSFRVIASLIGIAMLDLVNFYFLVSFLFILAYLTSKEHTNTQTPFVSLVLGIDLAAYIGHKSFGLFYFIGVLCVLEVLLRAIYKKSILTPIKKTAWPWVIFPILIIYIPNLVRSFLYTGDPFFPVFSSFLKLPCLKNDFQVRVCGDNHPIARFLYESTHGTGWGHGPIGIIKAFFLAPLPSNPFSRQGFFFGQNAGDFPVGLFWYFTWGLIVYIFIKSKNRKPMFLTLGICGLLFVMWSMISQQCRWLIPVIFPLSLFWGFALANVDWLKNKKIIFHILVSFSLLGTLVTTAKVALAQASTLTCFGVSCLKFQKQLFDDYNTKCSGPFINAPGRNHLSYLNCLSRTPRADFPRVDD